MRVLRLYAFLPPLPGGMEKHIRRLSEEQRKAGCSVSIAYNRGASTHPEDVQVLPWINLRRVRPQSLRDLVFFSGVAARVGLGRMRTDVVHVHGDWSAFLLARLVGRFTGARKYTASLHSVAKRGGLWPRVYRLSLRGYDLVYATGAADARYLGQLLGPAVRWQNSGIDPEFFQKVPDAPRSCDVITVANFFPPKNLDLVVEIAKEMAGTRFVLVGDGPERPRIMALCRDAGLSNVEFTGPLSSAEVHARLRTARIFLSTSFHEGTPTAVLEAMACGLAVVTSRSNDYDELIRPGISGYVVPGFEVPAYVDTLKELLGRPEQLEDIARRNALDAEKHRWPAVAERITRWMAEP